MAMPPATGAAAVAAAANVVHAGVAVLTDRALLELVTGFMTGYPYAVYKFSKGVDRTLLRDGPYTDARSSDDNSSEPSHSAARMSDVLFAASSRHGAGRRVLLPHFAIAANDREMLRLLFKLSKQPQFHDDLKLSFKRAMSFAVLYNRVEMLECLAELKEIDPDWKWEHFLIPIALDRDDPDLKVVEWLWQHLPRQSFSHRLENYMTPHTKRGDLDTVRWLHEHGWEINHRLVFEAAKRGRINLLKYFYDHDITHCGCEEDIRMHVVNYAARCGLLGLLKRFADGNDGRPLDTPNAIDHAAGCGHLRVVKYLHEHSLSGCTAAAISDAASGGHLEVVKFLHENRTEGCAADALDLAAQYGHLQTVQFLHNNYCALRCSVDAMDQTAASGHLEVLKFVHQNRIGQCSAAAIDEAAASGHLGVVKFLHENHTTEGCSPTAMDRAAERGHLEIVKFLFYYRTAGCSATIAIRVAARNGHLEIVQFLCEDHHHCEGDSTILAAM